MCVFVTQPLCCRGSLCHVLQVANCKMPKKHKTDSLDSDGPVSNLKRTAGLVLVFTVRP